MGGLAVVPSAVKLVRRLSPRAQTVLIICHEKQGWASCGSCVLNFRVPTGVERLGRDAEYTFQSSAKIKNEWSIPSLPHVSTAWCIFLRARSP